MYIIRVLIIIYSNVIRSIHSVYFYYHPFFYFDPYSSHSFVSDLSVQDLYPFVKLKNIRPSVVLLF